MSRKVEILYLGHGNTIDLQLKKDNVAQDLTAVTKISALFDATSVVSTDNAAGPIKWQSGSMVGWELGEVRIDCSSHDIAAKQYSVPVIVYDPSNTDGIVWGEIDIKAVTP